MTPLCFRKYSLKSIYVINCDYVYVDGKTVVTEQSKINTFEFNFDHGSTLAFREYSGICRILQFNNLELISHVSLTYECPLTGPMYFYLLGKCYFVDTTEQYYNSANDNCKTKFGNNHLGGLFEPKTLESSETVTNYAKSTSGKSYLWIGSYWISSGNVYWLSLFFLCIFVYEIICLLIYLLFPFQ